MADFLVPTCTGYLLKVQVVPGAQKTEIAGCHGDRLKIRVAAPPEKGRANEELLEFLARLLRLPRKSLRLTAGAGGRAKVVAVEDPSPQLRERLRRLALTSAP